MPDEGPISLRHRLAGLTRSVRPPTGDGVPWQPDLPAGRMLALPGRGSVFVRDNLHDGSLRGHPVLLLHGWTLSLDTTFYGLMPSLARRYPFAGFDQRGHGRTLLDARRFTIPELAADALAVLDELGIEKAIVCGFSLGGPVGLHLAVARPDRVAGLVLSAAALSYTQTRRDRLFWRAIAVSGRLPGFGAGTSAAARYFGANRRVPEFEARWPWLRRELARAPLSQHLATGRAVAGYDLRGRLAPLRAIPATVVVTEGDAVCPPRLQLQLAGQLGAHSIPVPFDHDFPVARPAAFGEAMLRAVDDMQA
ncbi:alpha/beta fold hydrolase [Amycolatopsis sp. NPDC051716]|uniref:alpha/beta fold hydrolase n=1 Tax=Amycolatopsis sp. NPDC051716 TaxID=3155804 RepID=UPI00344410E2